MRRGIFRLFSSGVCPFSIRFLFPFWRLGPSLLVILDYAGRISLSASPYQYIDGGILLFFTADYAVRFWKAEDRKQFFRSNIPDFLAIIPFSSLLSMFRIFRVLRLLKASRVLRLTRLLRAGAFLAVIRKRADGILHTNGLIYVIYVNLALILCSSVAMMKLEGMQFGDALWWSIVTCTTVGYGDISPTTAIGRGIAVVLMVFGIGLLGMVTGAIATYFSQEHRHEDKPNEPSRLPDELARLLEDADEEDIAKITKIAKIITKKNNP